MNFFFDEKINSFLKIIANSAHENNINVYLVGGIVRDNILSKPLKDIDLIVDSDAVNFSAKLPASIKIKSIHKDFSTVKVQYSDIEIDIASTRTESYPYSGCLPVVDKIGVDIRKDYMRRDFSINAMYAQILNIDDSLQYNLIDYAGGCNDIQNKILRVLHNNSYIDDPTRIIRGVGFKYRFNFDFSFHDYKLIEKFLSNFNIEKASTDRIVSVFKKIVNKDNFKEIIERGYYKIINNSDVNVDFKRLASLDFKLDSDFYLNIINDKYITKIKLNNSLEILKAFSKLTESELAYYFYKTQDNNVEKYLKIKDIKLLITGDDLLALGFKQGQIIGEILNKVLSEKIKNKNLYEQKENELNFARKFLPHKIK